MNRKKLYTILAAESVFLIVLCVLTQKLPDSFTSIFNFPFEQIGAGLSALHGIGSIGAGTAYALWVGISLLTAVPAVRGKKTPVERMLLALFALSVFATLYVMMDPWSMATPYDENGGFTKLTFSITTWSLLVLYLVVHVVRLLREGDRDKLTGYINTALYALAMLCAAYIVMYGMSTMQLAGVLGFGGLDCLFAFLTFAVKELPYALNIVIVIYVGEFMDAAWSGDAAFLPQKAERLTRMCCSTLIATAAMTAGFNILQALFSMLLTQVGTRLQIPVFSIAFTLFALLLTRIIVENRRLRDDNELFI